VDEFTNDGRQFFVKSSYLFAGWPDVVAWIQRELLYQSSNRVIE
jgi:hypothetical protein